MPARNFIEALAKGFKVLESLKKSKHGMTLQELTKELQMVKSSIFRVLYTLEELGYVEKSDKRYRLSVKCIELGKIALAQLELHEIALPFMERLREEFEETVNLGILEGDEVLFVEVLQSPHAFRFAQRAGVRGLLHSSALGKCLIAYLTEEELREIIKIKGLPGRTAHSITSFEGLAKELERVRTQGYAVDNEEDVIGIRCIAAPIFSDKNRSVASMSITGPSVRLPASRDLAVAEEVRKACLEISRHLGYSP